MESLPAPGSVESPTDDLALRSREIVGLLADPRRLRVVSALALGAVSLADVRRETGLGARDASNALRRLCDAGLVVRSSSGEHWLVEEAFGAAARAEALRRPTNDEHADAPRDEAKVLRAFVRDGRLVSIPSSTTKRLVILEWLAQQFEPGRRYREPVVNLILGRFHADAATLRRYLIDYGFMSREAGEYWRSGGRTDG
jgi:hypothetical protein